MCKVRGEAVYLHFNLKINYQTLAGLLTLFDNVRLLTLAYIELSAPEGSSKLVYLLEPLVF